MRCFKNYKNDEGPTLETLDYTIRIGNTTTFLYISICVSTLPTQHTTFISQMNRYVIKHLQKLTQLSSQLFPKKNVFVWEARSNTRLTQKSVSSYITQTDLEMRYIGWLHPFFQHTSRCLDVTKLSLVFDLLFLARNTCFHNVTSNLYFHFRYARCQDWEQAEKILSAAKCKILNIFGSNGQ